MEVQPNMEDIFVRNILAKSGYTGTGTLTKADPYQQSDNYTYGIKVHLTGAFNLPGPGAVYVSPVFPAVSSVSSNLSGLNLPERTLDAPCYGNISNEEFTLHFPKTVKIMSLPKDMHFSNDRVRYDSTYRQDGNIVTVARKFQDRVQGPVCTPEESKEYRTVGRDVFKDLKAQILFQPAD